MQSAYYLISKGIKPGGLWEISIGLLLYRLEVFTQLPPEIVVIHLPVNWLVYSSLRGGRNPECYTRIKIFDIFCPVVLLSIVIGV